MRLRKALPILGLLTLVSLAVEAGDAWARARSGGSRGSRSYSAPASPMPSNPAAPATPSRSLSQPSPAPTPSRGFFGGLMGGIAGFMLGGLLGSLLFGGLGGGFGIGLLEVLLIGAGLFLLYRWMSNRRRAEQPAYATAGLGTYGGTKTNTGIGGTAVMEAPPAVADLERGLGHVRQMDPGFDPAAFERTAAETFRKVQTAVGLRDVGMLRDRLTTQMHAVLQGQCDELKGSGRTNHVEQIQVERSETTEMWQEGGQDFVTVYLAGTLRDYTLDATGAVVAGSRSETEAFAEYWTFTRPVGPNAWKLAAIQTE